MTRFWSFIFLWLICAVGAFFGVWSWNAAGAFTLGGAAALFVHSLFGEDA